MVERSLKLDALNLNWLGVIDRYMDNLEKNTFKPYTPTRKKNCEIKGCVLILLNLVSLISVEKELGWGREISSAYYIRKLSTNT